MVREGPKPNSDILSIIKNTKLDIQIIKTQLGVIKLPDL